MGTSEAMSAKASLAAKLEEVYSPVMVTELDTVVAHAFEKDSRGALSLAV